MYLPAPAPQYWWQAELSHTGEPHTSGESSERTRPPSWVSPGPLPLTPRELNRAYRREKKLSWKRSQSGRNVYFLSSVIREGQKKADLIKTESISQTTGTNDSTSQRGAAALLFCFCNLKGTWRMVIWPNELSPKLRWIYIRKICVVRSISLQHQICNFSV